MLRFRRLYLVAVVVPAAAVALAHGCSNGEAFESVCDWLAYPGNCAREFHNDMQIYGTSSQDNPWGDCRTYPNPAPAGGVPSEANPGAGVVAKRLGNPNGQFLQRAMLATCVLDQGGQVTVSPPIDPTMWPPSPFAAPVTYTLTFMTSDGNTCGNATYTSPHGFSITVNGTGGSPTGCGGSTPTTSSSSSGTADPNQLLGCNAADPADTEDAGFHTYTGTFSEVIAPGADLFNVTCPTGESHTFNLNEVEGPTTLDGGTFSACPGLTPSVPSASFQLYPGGVDAIGAMSFAIHYPDPCVPPSDAGIVSDEPTQPADTVVYFNCTVPAQPETCVDTVKDGAETDVDCGGPYLPSKCNLGNCPARCMVGQHCLIDCDCASGLACTVDPMSGMKTCTAPGTGGDTTSSTTGGNQMCPASYLAEQNMTGTGGGCPVLAATGGSGVGGAGAGGTPGTGGMTGNGGSGTGG